MKKINFLLIMLLVGTIESWAQVGGNAASPQGGNAVGNSPYSGDKRNQINRDGLMEHPSPNGVDFYIDANLLLNTQADELVAIFGVSQEGNSASECIQKIDSRISEFINNLKGLGIEPKDIFVDFVTQNKVYDYAISGTVAKEKSIGFEAKKNVSIHFTNPSLLDKMASIASKSNIFDLIKVDYVLKDTSSVRKKLLEEASKVIKEKEIQYEKLFGIKLRTHLQLETEKYRVYFPSDMYSPYTPYETGKVGYEYKVQEVHKSKSLYFHPLDIDGFDVVINPVVLEPVVQCTLYLRIKYEIDR